jgi:hypothetical protein
MKPSIASLGEMMLDLRASLLGLLLRLVGGASFWVVVVSFRLPELRARGCLPDCGCTLPEEPRKDPPHRAGELRFASCLDFQVPGAHLCRGYDLIWSGQEGRSSANSSAVYPTNQHKTLLNR